MLSTRLCGTQVQSNTFFRGTRGDSNGCFMLDALLPVPLDWVLQGTTEHTGPQAPHPLPLTETGGYGIEHKESFLSLGNTLLDIIFWFGQIIFKNTILFSLPSHFPKKTLIRNSDNNAFFQVFRAYPYQWSHLPENKAPGRGCQNGKAVTQCTPAAHTSFHENITRFTLCAVLIVFNLRDTWTW